MKNNKAAAAGTVLIAGILGLARAPAGFAAPPGIAHGGGVALGLFERPGARALGDQGGIPRDQLIDMVQRRFNARVVRINLIEAGGRRVYEMRLLSEQRVWNVRVDAETGRVLEGGD